MSEPTTSDLAVLRGFVDGYYAEEADIILARVEAVIEAVRQADLCPLPEPYRSSLRAALAALDKGGET